MSLRPVFRIRSISRHVSTLTCPRDRKLVVEMLESHPQHPQWLGSTPVDWYRLRSDVTALLRSEGFEPSADYYEGLALDSLNGGTVAVFRCTLNNPPAGSENWAL